MSGRTYSGRCIGGPLDGKDITQPNRTFEVRTYEDTDPLLVRGTDVTRTSVQAYEHLSWFGVGIWQPVTQSAHHTVSLLVGTYGGTVNHG